MNKVVIAIICAFIIALGTAFMSYEIRLKKAYPLTNILINISNKSQGSTIDENLMPTKNNSNDKAKKSLFNYNIGFNIYYSNIVNTKYNPYKGLIKSRLHNIYGKDKNVTIKISYIFDTYVNGVSTIYPVYKIQYSFPNNDWFDTMYSYKVLPIKISTPLRKSPTGSFDNSYNNIKLSGILLKGITVTNGFNLKEFPSADSKTIATITQTDAQFVIQCILLTNSKNGYSFIVVNNKIGWIKTNALAPNSNMDIDGAFTTKLDNPVGYKLILTGNSHPGSNIELLKIAMNREFDNTGDTVTAQNISGYNNGIDFGCKYDLKYNTLSGDLTSKSNLSINGVTNQNNQSAIISFL